VVGALATPVAGGDAGAVADGAGVAGAVGLGGPDGVAPFASACAGDWPRAMAQAVATERPTLTDLIVSARIRVVLRMMAPGKIDKLSRAI